ncbi:MAG: hypothetical protein AAGA99_03975 [Actinomycetota bacterium]
MERYLLAAVLLIVAVGIAVVLDRRRRPTSVPSRRFRLPTHFDRLDLPEPELPWLLAIFTSTTCDTCRGVVEAAQPLRSETVGVAELPFQLHRSLHDKYEIEAVPAALLVDRAGEVQASWLGVIEPGDLWGRVSELVADDDAG